MDYEEDNEEKKKKRRTLLVIIILLIIIILILLYLIIRRIGKIGYIPTSTDIMVIKVTDDDQTIGNNTLLDIFNNEKYNFEKIIAPRSGGTYRFCIRNTTDNNLKCDIKFSDDMSNFVNMTYKLKMNNVYVKGNDKESVNIDNLDLTEIVVTANSYYIFDLDWYWADNDEKDTYVGSQKENQYYKLFVNVDNVHIIE